jgi:hypothetical protein
VGWIETFERTKTPAALRYLFMFLSPGVFDIKMALLL